MMACLIIFTTSFKFVDCFWSYLQFCCWEFTDGQYSGRSSHSGWPRHGCSEARQRKVFASGGSPPASNAAQNANAKCSLWYFVISIYYIIIYIYDRITLFESPMVSLRLLSSWNISNTVLFLRPEAMSLPGRTELSPDFAMHTSTNSSLLHLVALSSHAALASPILCCRLAISASVACLRWGKC